MIRIYILILILILNGCQKSKEPEKYIARVGDSYLTNEYINEYLKHSEDTSSLQYKLFLKKWIENEVLYLEASRKNIDESDKVQKQLAEVKKQLTVGEFLENEIYSKNIEISDEEINDYYIKNNDEFVLNEDVVKLNIVTFKERKPAIAFRAEILRTDDWSGALKKIVDDSVNSNMIVSITSSQLYTQLTLFPVELWKIAQNLQKNEVSFPVKIGTYFYIVQVLDKFLKNSIAPFDLVSEEIKNRLLIEKRKKKYEVLITSLLNKYKTEIKINE